MCYLGSEAYEYLLENPQVHSNSYFDKVLENILAWKMSDPFS
jgi:hypothetical protein